ncbi:LysR family transcriptional regulator, partial (plasmid) [Pseudomonas amygdali pv. morsprunorum]
MELRHLRYFITVAEHLSVSKAARHLHIVQPAL